MIIAFICGMLVIMIAQHSGLISRENDTLGLENLSKPDEVIIEQDMSASDASKFANIKNEAAKILSSNSYNLQEFAALRVNPLIDCVNKNREFDHKVYSYNRNNKNILIVVCHGYVDQQKNYGILIFEKYRHDYAQAVGEILAYWARTGNLSNTKFDDVILFTCFSGYAQQQTSMPIFNINLYMATDNRYINAYREEVINNEMVLHLYRGIPKNVTGANSNYKINSMLDSSKVVNQKSISDEEMKDIHILSLLNIDNGEKSL